MTAENKFKQSLKAGRLQVGLWTSFADPYAIEIVASAGFDWLLIDGEHAPNDLRAVLAQLQAVAAYPAQPVVRLPIGDPVLIKQFLDLGAHSLLIPLVESGKQAQQLVSATRYPPVGTRGVASARASRWGSITDYMARADELVCLLLQVETRKGLQNLEEILAVQGVDGIFIGPSDLAASLGHPGEPSHADVVPVIEDAITKIKASGKAAGVLTADPDLARAYIGRGVTFCAAGIDTIILSQALKALARKYDRGAPSIAETSPGTGY